MNPARFLAAIAFATLAIGARADEFAIQLKPGDGSEATRNNCAACHSLDYIQTNAPYLNAAGWTAEVTKMISVFGADVKEPDAKAIVEYLTRNYGG
jgi:mono/diheme cytochrome c family protein